MYNRLNESFSQTVNAPLGSDEIPILILLTRYEDIIARLKQRIEENPNIEKRKKEIVEQAKRGIGSHTIACCKTKDRFRY